MFDVVFFRWVNLILILVGVIYAHLVSRKLNSLYIGMPLLIWLFQALLFYLVYFGYHYEILIIQEDVAVKLISYWATASKTLGLTIMLIYLYYIQNSCWRGNGKL